MRGLRCLLTPLHAEPSLWHVLVKQLALEMPDIEFTASDDPRVNSIWVCGYEHGAAEFVRKLRRDHPHATLVVTGRGPVQRWGSEARDAGADHFRSWPLAYEELTRILHLRHGARHAC